jgi:hypothetical protein
MKLTVASPPQLSEAITLAVLGAGTWLAHCKTKFAGHEMDGGILSNTVMVWLQTAMLPQGSVAWYVRVIVNRFVHV